MMREGTTTFWSPNENNLSNKMRRGIHQSFKCENEEFMATQQTSSTLHYSCKDTTALTQTNKQHGFKPQNIMHSSLIQTCNTYTPTLHRSEVTTNTGNQNPPQILFFFFSFNKPSACGPQLSTTLLLLLLPHKDSHWHVRRSVGTQPLKIKLFLMKIGKEEEREMLGNSKAVHIIN